MIDVEEIDDNSSQEANLPPATLALATKKRAKTKDSPAVAPSSTLTRFLGPAGPPSRSAWDDVNRQCPVCQQTGFSSRSLALHVNDCLDQGRRAPDANDGESAAAGRKEAAGGVGNPDGRNTATAKTAVGKEASSGITDDVTGSGSREGNTRRMSREGTPKGKAVHRRGGEQQLRQDKAAKKAKTLQGGRTIDTEKAGALAFALQQWRSHGCDTVNSCFSLLVGATAVY